MTRRIRAPIIIGLVALVATLTMAASVGAAGTRLVKDTGSKPVRLGAASRTLYFTTRDDGLWMSDGRPAGTKLVRGDLSVKPEAAWGARRYVGYQGDVFLSANGGGGYELWKTDGTAGGTTLVKSLESGRPRSGPAWFAKLGGSLFFGKNLLWTSDGTMEGTTPVAISDPPEWLAPAWLTTLDGMVLFTAVPGRYGRGTELWRTDGTEAGTRLVKAIGHDLLFLTRVDRTVYLTAGDSANGIELWRSDGTPDGTRRVKDIRPGAASSFPEELTRMGGSLYFVSDDGVHGEELWRSDGTAKGTRLVKDINPGAVGSDPQFLTPMNGVLYLVTAEGRMGHGFELWRSDGTAKGTRLVKDIRPGIKGSFPRALTRAGRTLFFSADDGQHGKELWRSRGTRRSTRLVKDIRRGPEGSGISSLTRVGGSLLFVAKDRLWRSVP